jgi:hypothetical protein
VGRSEEEIVMATDADGREGLSAGGLSKELGVSPAKVKRALATLEIEPDFVKSGCAYYYADRTGALKNELTKG